MLSSSGTSVLHFLDNFPVSVTLILPESWASLEDLPDSGASCKIDERLVQVLGACEIL